MVGEAELSAEYNLTRASLLWSKGVLDVGLSDNNRNAIFGLTLGFVHRCGLGQLN
jgi:hypothetical protein